MAAKPKRARKLPAWALPYEPIALGLTTLLGQLVEVVLHDVRTDRILGIWGTLSGRKIGDESLLDDLGEPSVANSVIGPYEKVTMDGRRITSISVVIGDEAIAVGVLCVNIDRSPLDRVNDVLATFLAPTVSRPPELFTRDWREQTALTVSAFCNERGIERTRMSRHERIQLIGELDARGVFNTRNAANLVAETLGLSRASIYSLLKEARND